METRKVAVVIKTRDAEDYEKLGHVEVKQVSDNLLTGVNRNCCCKFWFYRPRFRFSLGSSNDVCFIGCRSEH